MMRSAHVLQKTPKLLPNLVAASRTRGRFVLAADMLVFVAEAELAARTTPAREGAA